MGNRTKTLLTVIIFIVVCSSVYADQGDSIVFNPKTGNYLITYYSAIDKKIERLVFIPATKFKPKLKNIFKLDQDGVIHYQYTLISGSESQQNIVLLILDPVTSVVTRLSDIPLNSQIETSMGDLINKAKLLDTPPAPWESSMNYANGGKAYRFGLMYPNATGGLLPGNKLGFGYRSLDLPGIIQAEIHSYAADSQDIDGEEIPEAADGGFGKQYFELIRNNFLRRSAAVPTIVVPTPFNTSVLLGNIQTQMHTWIGLQLLDATFSSQLDRYLAASTNAFNKNEIKAGKEGIKTVLNMLKQEHQDIDLDDDKEDVKFADKSKPIKIDRLAAKVLTFNLQYLLKRLD